MLFQRYYFYCVSIPSDFEIMFENVKRKYIQNREKYGDLFKTNRTNIVAAAFIGSLIFLSLSVLLFFPAIFLPSHYSSTKWCVFLSVLFLLMGLTFFLTALIKVLYRGYSVFNRSFFVFSYILCELIIIELGFIIGYIFFVFFIPFYFPLYFGLIFIPITQLMLILVFFILFYLFSNLTYKAVVVKDLYVEYDNRTLRDSSLKTLFNQNPFLIIIILLTPYVGLLILGYRLLSRSKEEVTVINKVT